MHTSRLSCLALAFALLTACGGGGGEPLPGRDVGVSAFPSTTGIVLADASGNVAPEPRLNQDGWDLVVGDGSGDVVAQTFLDFNIGGFSSTGTVHRATLRVLVANDTGDPIGSLGTLRVDAINIGPSLDASDYLSPNVIQVSVGTLIDQSSAGWHSLDVTSAVRTAHDLGHTAIGFRLRFPVLNNGNNLEDSITFGDRSSNEVPELVIRFEGNVF